MRHIHTLFKFVSIGLVAALLTGNPAQAQKTAGENFAVCAACHKVGGGRLIGPDLAGVTERRSEEWLLSFIRDSAAFIKSGDADAVAIFEEYAKFPMPPNPLTDAEIRAVLAHIVELESSGGSGAPSGPTPIETATEEDFELGRAIFTGETRLENGGASCQSCHQVTGVGTMGGGNLAVDLTRVVSRMGGAGALAIVSSPPFPMMTQAYADKPLTDKEVFAVVAFLEKTDRDQVAEASGMAGIGFLFTGLIGCAILIGIYSLLWKGRKRGCVYDEIHARQLGTE